MDFIIDLAKQLGIELQKTDEYINCDLAKQAMEADANLQNLIGEFNLQKISINNEISKQEINQEKIDKLNKKIKLLYEEISKNENSKNFNKAKEVLNNLMRKIITIITLSAEGHDPYFAEDYYENSNGSGNLCSGGCSSCGGC